ncbi:MAG: DUF58 domain-containing protein [Proteobacteria bacterium]|nr:DUF58 domain-containing protein [Pseudomonadota bacterium]
MNAAGAVRSTSSPARIELAELIRLKPAGESLKIGALRVRATDAGGHLSRLKGRGVEFDESRPYQPGDDLRTMDWKVTARTGKPHTKVFREERDRPVILWLDLRRPMLFATKGVFKAVRAAQTAALVAWSAVANGDRLGGLIFSDREHVELRPRLGRRAALRMLRVICDRAFWDPAYAAAAAAQPHSLERLTRVARPGSQIFLLSDFRSLDASFERHLRQLARHSDVCLVHFFDPVERSLPPPGRYRVLAGSRSVAIDTGGGAERRAYRDRFIERRAALAKLARFPGVQLLECGTHGDPQKVLSARFAGR